MKNYFSLKNSKGFTLIETLVAISIFSISVLGLFAVLTQGTANTAYAKKKLTAAYLAQEGIEYVRNMRDTMTLYPDAAPSPAARWNAFRNKLTGAGARCHLARGCYFDSSGLSYTDQSGPMMDIVFTQCGGACPELKYDDTKKEFGYDPSGTVSGFTRKINAEVVNPNEIKVTSSVSWKYGVTTYTVSFAENLFNWAE